VRCCFGDTWALAISTHLDEVLVFSYHSVALIRRIVLTTTLMMKILVHECTRSLFTVLAGRLIRVSLVD
jgi:hypothetical protein